MSDRLSLALAKGAVSLPEAGRVLLLRPPATLMTEGLPLDRCVAVTGFRPDHDAFAARGVPVAEAVTGEFAAAIVFLTRARALSFDLLAQAVAALPEGAPVIVDGAKTDGVEPALKAVRAVAETGEVFAKAHGKCFAFSAPGAVPKGWAATPGAADGFVTAPGVFSADGIDPGSALLAPHLAGLSGRVCDLGAGWGYLSVMAAASPEVTEIHLVEAERAALDCARINLPDPRASFHWADATRFAGGPFDTVISNPPFHAVRKAEPEIGRGFIRAAARLLSPRGRFLLVANRHLPYEAALSEAFAETVALEDRDGYKVLQARKPRRPARSAR
ncbi:class I SAM-dependent methyltransferase [Jannaschia ovalis]|uniref:Methyltransferase n=1 Tax=Jannaschia ovalis TaxID=3038773 RepID=A0ABY8LEP2_9RHOB|nr:class I SAM-dependent methyltransferase [Jannaschia sp. GRR-S6-38]WGH79762.1 methyltransferase [Jannaschia sp. GRR-S6-38]